MEPRQDRSRATRRRLLDAAVLCLADAGWAGSTVALVASRAGVSRGAAQHHFRTREELFIAALRHAGATRTEEMRRRAAELPPGPGRTRAVVTMLVDAYTGPGFAAGVQLWAAAASDPALRAQVLPLEEEVGRQAHRAAVDMLGVDEAAPGVRAAVQGCLDLARGLGLAGLLADDRARRERVVRQWARMLDAAVADAREPAHRPVR